MSYRKNFNLALRCAARFVRHGASRASARAPQRVVVVQLGKLGDMVCSTPVFHAIKKSFPHTHVTVVGREPYRELLQGNKDIDEYIGYVGSVDVVIAELQKNKYDFGCTITPGFLGLAMLYISGIPSISAPRVLGGFCPQQTLSYRTLLQLVITVPYVFGQYVPRLMLNLLEPLGIASEDTTKHLTFSAQGDQKVNKLLSEHGIDSSRDMIVGIAPSAGNKIKNWPSERFAYLAEKLIGQYRAKIIIIGGPADNTEVEGMMSALSDTAKVANFSQQLAIDELKALVSKLHVLIAVDTGPIYIAEAFEVPTLDITGAIDEREQAPRGSLHVNVVPPDPRMPQLHILNIRAYNAEEARRQIESITVGMVMEAFTRLEKLISSTRPFSYSKEETRRSIHEQSD